jgi:EAL and modified HD-GYP domain-containing signal transduction protein
MRAAASEARAPGLGAAGPQPNADGPSSRPADAAVVRVARQPILDRNARVIGYELLFRAPRTDTAGVRDDRKATATVIVDGLLDVGLWELVGEREAYLNVSRDFLLTVRPLPLPAGRVVLELLESQAVDDELCGALAELTAQGFTIALDDFRFTRETERLLRYAKIVKVDVIEHRGEALRNLIGRLRSDRPDLGLLAEKVETKEEFERCRAMGFEAFQGNFFSRPARVRRHRLPSQGLTALNAMVELEATEEVEELHRIITRDAGMSVRLLRYANSAYVALPRRVGSVQEALVWLGAREVRRFAMMIALAGARDIPDVLLTTALARARMCRQVSGAGDGKEGDSYFTVGLLSVADALADAPMEDVIGELPFREDIAAALLDGGGELGKVLNEVIAYERGDFDGASDLTARRGDIDKIYRDATKWADEGLTELI